MATQENLNQTQQEYLKDANVRYEAFTAGIPIDARAEVKARQDARAEEEQHRLRGNIVRAFRRISALGGVVAVAAGVGVTGNEIHKASDDGGASENNPTMIETDTTLVHGGPAGKEGEVRIVSTDNLTPAQANQHEAANNSGQLPGAP